ncbi:hypothetical protein AaE_001182 [Aphanomyces astaci]|uniref:Tc3 transposase DNA binding domain-containing protein n=1 Tax=Aphanomyces astaci TaxID=112090 RepID=A0A6A5AD44_APHAT|nr:hypothetical protein AaE_001182 [Aphanomyces astaci]
MGLGSLLSAMEQGMVLALRRHGLSIRAIAVEISRSTKAVRTFLKDPEQYGTRFKGRKAGLIIGREYRLLVREASKTGMSARSLKTSLNLDASLRICQRRLLQAPNLSYVKRKPIPALTKRHKKARVEHAKKHLAAPPDWGRIIWSDEKRFNLDGPDGLQHYWHDLRIARHVFHSSEWWGWGHGLGCFFFCWFV